MSLDAHSFYMENDFKLSKAKGKVHNILYSLLKKCQDRWHFLGSYIMWRDPFREFMRFNSLFTQMALFNISSVLWNLYIDSGKLLLLLLYIIIIYDIY